MNSKGISDKVIRYIEHNMDGKINLETISKVMNYSKFHFHRLFLSEMGISIIDYIRKRRLASASYTLRTTELSITAIAMRNGFSSVDTFIRNFKSYYGITPSHYRKLSMNPVATHVKECEDKMMNKYEMIRACSVDEKEKALYMLDRMIDLSKAAHNKGLLSLENEIRNDDLKFLKKSLELLLKGTEYQVLENILTNYMMSSDLNNYEILLRVLILEGILLLHEGAYPWDVRIKLSSYFGEGFIEVLDDKYNNSIALKKFLDTDAMDVDSTKLIKEIKFMNERVLQRVFRECDIILIAISLMGMEKANKVIVYNSLSLGQRRILSEVLNSLTGINVKHVVDANNEIIRVIQSLRLSKDI